MSILINKDTRIVTQGITGNTGEFHTTQCIEYANGRDCFVAGVTPGKAGQTVQGVPVYDTVADAKEKHGVNASVIYVPPRFAASAIDEAIDAELDLVICITEGIPVADMIKVRDRMRKKNSKTILVGPNCPGVITPDEVKIGIMPSQLGMGQSTCVGIGGDPVNGMKHVDVMKMFNDDPETEAVVMCGEIGGTDEEECAAWIKDNMTKPVVGFIAGVTAPPGKRMGHAGAIISGGQGTAQSKIDALEAAGVHVTLNPSEMGSLLKKAIG